MRDFELRLIECRTLVVKSTITVKAEEDRRNNQSAIDVAKAMAPKEWVYRPNHFIGVQAL